ncbi:MAG: hypothetical protein ACE5J6_03585 [Candidatus Bathyarchaeia archaeon]
MTTEKLFEAVVEYEGLLELMAKVESFAQLLYATNTLHSEKGPDEKEQF